MTEPAPSIAEAVQGLSRPVRIALIQSYGERAEALEPGDPLRTFWLAVGTEVLEEHRRIGAEESDIIARAEADLDGITYLDSAGNELDPAG